MNPILKAALDAICREREAAAYSAAFDAVEALHRAYREEYLANRLYREIPCSVPFEIVCELLDILAWETPDNGAAVQRTLESWLREGTDNRKLLIALHVEIYPYINAREMYAVLSRLEATATPRIREMIRLRQEQEERVGRDENA